MSVVKQIDLICDECDVHYDDAQWSVGQVRKSAREDGWKYRDGKDICGRCANPNEGN